MHEIEMNLEHMRSKVYIEFQYSESFQFFSLFKMQNLEIERVNEISAIQYQDLYKLSSSERAILFPKVLIFELINYPLEYQKYNVRIYEKKYLDTKILSTAVYFHLEGQTLGTNDEPITDPKFKNV